MLGVRTARAALSAAGAFHAWRLENSALWCVFIWRSLCAQPCNKAVWGFQGASHSDP